MGAGGEPILPAGERLFSQCKRKIPTRKSQKRIKETKFFGNKPVIYYFPCLSSVQIPIGLVKKPFIQPTGTFTRGKQTFTTLTTIDNTAIRLSR